MNSEEQARLYSAQLRMSQQNKEEIERILGEQNRTTRKKLLFLFYYEKNGGNTTKACHFSQVKSTKTVYNWKESDPEFAEALQMAIRYQQDVINDIATIRMLNRSGPMVRWWLSHRHPDFMRKVEVKVINPVRGRYSRIT